MVLGSVTRIVDQGPVDPAGSITHFFSLEVVVTEPLKGLEQKTVRVTTIGVGDARELSAGLSQDVGLWILMRNRGDDLVPLHTTSVVFPEGSGLVALRSQAW